MATSFRVKDSGELKVFKTLKVDFEVGILPEDFNAKHSSGMTVGQLGELHEYGHGNIKPRMWFRGWFNKNASRTQQQIVEYMRRAVRTQKFDPAELQVVAMRAKSTMVGPILAGMITPKNTAGTLAKKKPETRPLVDTKAFVSAIHARVSVKSGIWGRLVGRGVNWTHKS